jgi:hypothetical protein
VSVATCLRTLKGDGRSVKQEQETLYRRILEAIETKKIYTNQVNLHSMDLELARATKQLRQVGYIDGTLHDLANGSVAIEGVPIITVEGRRFLNELRSKVGRKASRIITIVWTVIIGLSSIVSGIYYLLHLRSHT